MLSFLSSILGGSIARVLYEELNGQPITIPKGVTTYINTDCPPEGLTINACGREGRVIIYISKTTIPSSAMYDEIIEIMEGSCGNAYIYCPREEGYGGGRRKRQSPESDSIYIAIEGVGEDNEYELNATTGDTSTPKGKHVLDKQYGYNNNLSASHIKTILPIDNVRYGMLGLYSNTVIPPIHIPFYTAC